MRFVGIQRSKMWFKPWTPLRSLQRSPSSCFQYAVFKGPAGIGGGREREVEGKGSSAYSDEKGRAGKLEQGQQLAKAGPGVI